MTDEQRKPVIAHAWMSVHDMVKACGFTLRRSSTWTYSVFSASTEKLFTGTMPMIKRWLRNNGHVV